MIDVKDISFVIPSNREFNRTLSSIPKECEVVISSSTPLGRARNAGILKAARPWIVLCDDDIKFSKTFLGLLCELAKERRIVGLEAYYPSPFVIGRLMMFSKTTWEEIGKFDIRSHGDETEWQLRGIEEGCEIVRLSRDCVYHYHHQKVKPKSEFSNLFYLLKKHPTFPFYILKRIIKKMKESSDKKEYL